MWLFSIFFGDLSTGTLEDTPSVPDCPELSRPAECPRSVPLQIDPGLHAVFGSLGDKAAPAAKSIPEWRSQSGTRLGDNAAAAAKSSPEWGS